MPQRRRRIVVDGTLEARQAHGRPVPLQLCRTAARRLPAVEPQREPHDGQHIAPEQRPAREADAPEGEDVPEAIHCLCSSLSAQPRCCGAPDRKGRRCRAQSEREHARTAQAVFLHEEVVDRE